MIFLAGGNDVLAGVFSVAPETITNLLRVLVLALPVAVFFLTRRVCHELRRRPSEPAGSGVVVRTAEGGYEVARLEEKGSH
jgi:ubiquinol-cytochrome c reductase cytochrome b subunit